MKKLLKLIIKLLIFIFIIGAIFFGIFVAGGYDMYQKSLAEASIEERINEIRNKENYVTIDNIPADFKNAIIAVEDHRFESHGAIDLISIGRAIVRNVSEFRLVEGGSTITQQFAKNTFFTQEKSFVRKVAEVFVAIDLEEMYTKDEIIEMYMNTIYFGDGFYGISSASHGYFNKEPIELTLDELTLLAGIPNAPGIYSLSNNPDLARQRQKQVIGCMVEYGYLSKEDANKLL